MSGGTWALEASNIDVHYGTCRANDGVSLQVAPGSIHGLLGENGAGKSTLCKVLFGLVKPQRGTVDLLGKSLQSNNARQSMAAGLGMVHQHFMLVPTLTVAENVVLGAEPSHLGVLDTAAARAEVLQLSQRFGLEVDPDALAGSLPVGVQQRVEILKALRSGAKVLILDEPTAVLTPPEVKALSRVLKGLRDEGRSILLVTHKLPEVLDLCDAITVMRGGKVVARMEAPLGTVESISQVMVGRPVDLGRQDSHTPPGEVRLEAVALRVRGEDGRMCVEDVSLSVRAGEVVGIAGVEGNGQTELAAALAGVLPVESGSVMVGGVDVTTLNVAQRHDAGLSHVPEDRLTMGLAAPMRVDENLVLGMHHQAPFARHGLTQPHAIAQHAQRILEQLDVRPLDPAVPASALSGGNQQKLVVGRELSRNPRVLVLAQPTRGVDVGAMERIHAAIRQARDAGTAILLLSAELSELLALSNTIHVMYRGRLVASLPGATATAEQLGPFMLSGAAQPASPTPQAP